MGRMRIIPPNMRNQFRCGFCGETRSVKYIMDIDNPELCDTVIGIPCCNKCALKNSENTSTRGVCNYGRNGKAEPTGIL